MRALGHAARDGPHPVEKERTTHISTSTFQHLLEGRFPSEGFSRDWAVFWGDTFRHVSSPPTTLCEEWHSQLVQDMLQSSRLSVEGALVPTTPKEILQKARPWEDLHPTDPEKYRLVLTCCNIPCQQSLETYYGVGSMPYDEAKAAGWAKRRKAGIWSQATCYYCGEASVSPRQSQWCFYATKLPKRGVKELGPRI